MPKNNKSKELPKLVLKKENILFNPPPLAEVQSHEGQSARKSLNATTKQSVNRKSEEEGLSAISHKDLGKQ